MKNYLLCLTLAFVLTACSVTDDQSAENNQFTPPPGDDFEDEMMPSVSEPEAGMEEETAEAEEDETTEELFVTVDNRTDGEIVVEVPALISGSVSESATKVSVNGWELSKYEPGSGEWNYFASPDYQNLATGENTFEIVATDASGATTTAILILNYEPAEEAAVETETAE